VIRNAHLPCLSPSLGLGLTLLLAAAGLAQVPAQPPVLRAEPLTEQEAQLVRPRTGAEEAARLARAAAAPVTPPAPAAPAAPLSPAPAVAAAPANPPAGEDAVRVQIFLERKNFGPGVVDGRIGLFTKLAAETWFASQGMGPVDWDVLTRMAREAVPAAYTTSAIPESAKDWVDTTLPTSRSGQAARKRMSYRSIGEYMAERFHASIDFLVQLNGAAVVANATPGTELRVPNVQPFLIESIAGTQHKADERLSQRVVVVDTKMNQLRIFARVVAFVEPTPTAQDLEVKENAVEVAAPQEGTLALLAAFPITPGRPEVIHFGTWKMATCVDFPFWRYDQQFLDTGKRSDSALNIPPGPNSPVGVMWGGLTKSGIGIHGTDSPETIGRARSSGCIRMANWDVARLPGFVRPGATVEVR
jgi:lipoprotein-anchoring transpeptidase ErfK/SrfK